MAIPTYCLSIQVDRLGFGLDGFCGVAVETISLILWIFVGSGVRMKMRKGNQILLSDVFWGGLGSIIWMSLIFGLLFGLISWICDYYRL
jgi:hypothetical protein